MKIKIRYALLVFSIVLIAAGVLNGGIFDVWSRAAVICRECIGLG